MSLGSLPLALQQRAIVEDLLFLMNGVDGRLVVCVCVWRCLLEM